MPKQSDAERLKAIIKLLQTCDWRHYKRGDIAVLRRSYKREQAREKGATK